MSRNILAIRIEERRNAARENQEKLADALTFILGRKIYRENIYQWESDSRKPKVDVIKALAQHFNCSTDYLLGLSDAPTNDKDLSFVCSYTGLSQEAVSYLHGLNVKYYQHFVDFMLTRGSKYLESATENLFGATRAVFMETYKEKTESDNLPLTHSDGKTNRAVFYDLHDAFNFYEYRANADFAKMIEVFLGSPEAKGGDADAE